MKCAICHQGIVDGQEVYQVKRGLYQRNKLLLGAFWVHKTYLDENLCHVSCLLKAGIDLTSLMFSLER